jgi:predicted RNA-binding Zn ribbon-like protein
MLAQHSGAWERLETCPYPPCGIAFYDESKNNSRVWHDVKTCGNRTNLAASRGRRRADSGCPA